MRQPLRMRELTAEEARVITKLARSQSASVRLVQRAKIIALAHAGQSIPQIVKQVGMSDRMVRKWWKRFEQQGLTGLEDAPRPGTPAQISPEQKAQVIQAARTRPSELGLPFSSWTFERLATYLQEQVGIPIKKTRVFEILQEEGLRWHKQESWYGERLDPEFAEKRGSSKP